MKLEIMNVMKTDILKKESEKRNYISPVIECIKLDNEISLILNSFDGLPGDPNPDCVEETGGGNSVGFDDPYR